MTRQAEGDQSQYKNGLERSGSSGAESTQRRTWEGGIASSSVVSYLLSKEAMTPRELFVLKAML